MSWSPCGSYLIVAAQNHDVSLRLFDLRLGRYRETFGWHDDGLNYTTWSRDGRYIATGSEAFDPHLKLWECTWDDTLFGPELREIRQLAGRQDIRSQPRQYFDKTHGAWRGVYGFSSLEFSPDSAFLAAVAERREDEDFVMVFDPRTLEVCEEHLSDGHVTGLSWTCSGETSLVYVSERQAYRVPVSAYGRVGSPSSVASDVDTVACHPTAALCAFLSHQQETAGDRHDAFLNLPSSVTVKDIDSGRVLSRFAWSGRVSGMRWSGDGRRLFAFTYDGFALSYRLPIRYRHPSLGCK